MTILFCLLCICKNRGPKGLFTSWPMKLSHVGRRLSMVTLYGPTLMVRFLKYAFSKPLGPLPGVNQTWTKRSDHVSKSGWVDLLNICPKRVGLRISSCMTFSPFSSLITMEYVAKKKKTLLCHGPLTFATRKPPPSLPPQNSFYHDSGWCRLENRPFGDLKFYGHSYNFFLMQTEVFLGWVQQRITYFREARHNFMVHDVNNPLEWEKNPHFLLVVGYWKPSEPQRGSTTCK